MKKKTFIIVLSAIVAALAVRWGLGLYFKYYIIERFTSNLTYNENSGDYSDEDRPDEIFLLVYPPNGWDLYTNFQVTTWSEYDADGNLTNEPFSANIGIHLFEENYTMGISLGYTNNDGEVEFAQIELDSHGNLIDDEMSALDISVYESKRDRVEEILDACRETWGLFLEE